MNLKYNGCKNILQNKIVPLVKILKKNLASSNKKIHQNVQNLLRNYLQNNQKKFLKKRNKIKISKYWKQILSSVIFLVIFLIKILNIYFIYFMIDDISSSSLNYLQFIQGNVKQSFKLIEFSN